MKTPSRNVKRRKASQRKPSWFIPQGIKTSVLIFAVVVGQLIGLPQALAREDLRDITQKAGTSNYFNAAPGGISVRKATAIVRQSTGGRVLSVTTKQRSSGTEHRVRVLVDGERVMTVIVDAHGRIKDRR